MLSLDWTDILVGPTQDFKLCLGADPIGKKGRYQGAGTRTHINVKIINRPVDQQVVNCP